jgi:uncharacterized protein (TIGR00255 family)
MIQSMTGYGMGVSHSENYKVTVEFKSLNSKYLELILKLPRTYMKYEHLLRNQLTKELERGKIAMLLNVEVLNPTKRTLRINHTLLDTYINDLKAIQSKYALQPLTLEKLLDLPDVMIESVAEEDEEEWNLIKKATAIASEALIKSRKEEGKALETDFLERLVAIEAFLGEVEAFAPQRIEDIRNKMKNTLEEIKSRVEVDLNRFEQELIFYIEKLDINEEIVRLRQHVRYFKEVIKNPNNSGKQLNFISQEMGREINTIGSKANHVSMQRAVVGMKEELEKIKEQTMNIV